MTPEAGTVLAHYRLAERLGVGGMGEVWRASDTTLGREVAIKLLPPSVSTDPDRRSRFEREAKVLASLNHPNIATVHGYHEIPGSAFLVMELVPGEDLASRIARGPFPVVEAIEIARDVAAALAAAHDAGIVHRDLKPANVKRTPEGKVKVLDFGLAKAIAPDSQGSASGSTPTFLPTITSAGTAAGMILGTAAYMSPEQARGLAVDRRTDLWAFGCLLYEMLSGRRAFDGPTVTDVLAAVVTREPDWSALPPETPPSVHRLLRRCLEKDARRRIRDAGDAGLLLDERGEHHLEASLAEGPGSRPRGGSLWPWVVAACLAAGWIATTWIGRGTVATVDREPIRLSVRLTGDLRLAVENNLEEHPILAISPDGSTLAFAGVSEGVQRIYVRRLDKNEIAPIAGSENGTAPFFSPDGRWVAFFSRGKLKKAALAGGQPIDLCDVGLSRGGTWGPDDTIVFSPTTASGLMRVPSTGGTPVELTRPDPAAGERTHRWPAFLPGGREVVFTVGTLGRPGNYEDSSIDAVSLADGKRRTVVVGGSMARALASGDLLLGRLEQVLFVKLGAGATPNARNAVPVLDGVGGMPTSGALFFDVAANGTLVFAEADPLAAQVDLVRISRDGTRRTVALPPRPYIAPSVSPDGTKVAISSGLGSGREGDIWVHDATRETFSRLTLDGRSSGPVWTPDGKRIAYGTVLGVGEAFAWRPVDGSDEPTTLKKFSDGIARSPSGFSPDGRWLLFQQDSGPGRSLDQLALSIPDGTVLPIAETPALELQATLSPDGRWVAYVSDETGRTGIYVQSFPKPSGRWEVAESGLFPRWSRDGRELYFIDNSKLYAVPVTGGASFSFGTATPRFDLPVYARTDTYSVYDTTPDGGFVAILPRGSGATSRHLDVVLGFTGTLTKE